TPAHGGSTIGLGGRYLACVCGLGNKALMGSTPMTNGGFPLGWIVSTATATNANTAAPAPQVPFKVVLCGNYGTFGNGAGTSNVPGTTATNQGGPVGPDGSTLNRHSARW